MKKKWYGILILAAVMLTAGCGIEKSGGEKESAAGTEADDHIGFFSTEDGGVAGFFSAEEDEDVVSL
ncbi:MAG: hypothetical protein J6C37_07015, partial [Roseburia sp.]|nr:hypothetical protein [Roseburia sp.]